MSITTLAKKVLQYPWNHSNAVALKAWVDAVTTAGNAGTLTANALSADETGRAVMASGLFDAATVALKFAANCFAANATIRALFAAGLIDSATATSIIAAGAIPISKIAPSSIDGTQVKVGAAGNTVGILPELFIITVADGSTVLDAVTLDATYGKIKIKDVYFVKGPTTGGSTDAVQLFADSGGSTTPISSSLALNGIAEGGVVRTTSLLNTTVAAGAHLYVKRTSTTNNAGELLVLAYRIT